MKRLRDPVHIPATCPTCKGELVEYDVLYNLPTSSLKNNDYICPTCQDRVFPDTPWYARLANAAQREWDKIRGIEVDTRDDGAS